MAQAPVDQLFWVAAASGGYVALKCTDEIGRELLYKLQRMAVTQIAWTKQTFMMSTTRLLVSSTDDIIISFSSFQCVALAKEYNNVGV